MDSSTSSKASALQRTSKRRTGSSRCTLALASTLTSSNPNGRIPALTDSSSGKPHHVFESASILLWLVENYDVGCGPESTMLTLIARVQVQLQGRSRALRGSFVDLLRPWVTTWCLPHADDASGLGPMQGQANHFLCVSSCTMIMLTIQPLCCSCSSLMVHFC